MDKNLFEIDSYFNTTDDTQFVYDFVHALVDATLPVWSDFETGLIFTTMNGIPSLPAPPGGVVKLNISTIPGTLVSAKPFKGILDNYELPSSFAKITPHMEHFLKALDIGSMLTMLNWTSLFVISPTDITDTNLSVGPWQTSPVPVPGPTVGALSNGLLSMSRGKSSSTGVGDDLYNRVAKFIMDRRKFPDKTEFLLSFLRKYCDLFQKTLENWLDARFISGGSVVIIYMPPAGVPTSGPPVIVAQKVTE